MEFGSELCVRFNHVDEVEKIGQRFITYSKLKNELHKHPIYTKKLGLTLTLAYMTSFLKSLQLESDTC